MLCDHISAGGKIILVFLCSYNGCKCVFQYTIRSGYVHDFSIAGCNFQRCLVTCNEYIVFSMYILAERHHSSRFQDLWLLKQLQSMSSCIGCTFLIKWALLDLPFLRIRVGGDENTTPPQDINKITMATPMFWDPAFQLVKKTKSRWSKMATIKLQLQMPLLQD